MAIVLLLLGAALIVAAAALTDPLLGLAVAGVLLVAVAIDLSRGDRS